MSGLKSVPRRSRVINRLALGASAIALSGLAAAPAFAQAAAQTGIETVTVTAQYITQNIQQTPLSISVVTSQDLEQRGITNLAQLGTTIPGLSLIPAPAAFGNSLDTYIRGVGQYDTAFASEPGVGMYVDGFYYGTMSGSELDLLDLSNVEVDRGPQGVLGGKNDIGGAIKLFTQKPTDDNSGYIQGTYGAFDDIETKGAANLVVVPGHLFLRISAYSKNQNGYVNQMDYACIYGPGTNASGPGSAGSLPVVTQNNGCKIGTQGGFDTAGARAALRFVYDAHLEDTFALDVVRDDSPLTPDVLYAVDNGTNVYYNKGNGIQVVPRTTFIGAALGGASNVGAAFFVPVWNAVSNIPRYGIPWDQRFIPNGSAIYNTTYATYSDEEGQYYNDGELMHSWSMSNILDYDLPWWNIHFKSITGYRYYNGAYSNDQDVSPMSYELTTTYPTDREFQEEGRFTGSLFNDHLEWTAGVFYYNRTNRATGPVTLDAFYDIGEAGIVPSFEQDVFEQNDTYKAENTSEYLYGIYHILDNWEVLGGFRYTTESKIYYFDHLDKVPGYPDGGFFRNAVNPACDEVIDAACPANAPLVPNTVKTKRPDFRAGTDYHITDDLMAYFTWSTGYRSGGFNSRPFDPYQLLPGNGSKYGPESIDSYEVGAKTQFFDNRLQLDVSLFDADYQHVIFPISKTDPFGEPWVYYTNLGSQTNKGVEFQAQASPIDNMLITANYSYVKVDVNPAAGHQPGYVDGCTAAAAAAGICGPEAAGENMIGSSPILFPKETFNLSAQYAFKTGMGQVTPRLEYDWQSTVYEDGNNDPYTAIPSRGLLNGTLTWDAPDNAWQIQLLVNNITDKHYFLSMFDLMTFGEGTVEAQPGMPREWFLQVKKTF